ncbi:MAG: hypothetical protein ACJ746_02765 [Bryobacteraceae bacterium]
MSNNEWALMEARELRTAAVASVLDRPAPSPLLLTVLFTTVPATFSALREAAKLANELGGRVRVLVSFVVPYPLDLDRPRVDPLFRLRHFRAVCDEHSAETFIDVRLCRDKRRCIHDALPPHSLVLIGVRAKFWPFGSEKVLAKDLRNAGHEVLLVTSTGRPKLAAKLLAQSLGSFQRFAFGIEGNNLADVQALYARFNLGGVSHKQE